MKPTIVQMRESLSVLTRTSTADSQGGRGVTWRVLDTAKAAYVPVRAGERLQSQTLQAQLDHRFRIHARSDITAQMRAKWRPSWLSVSTPKTLEIHGVIPDPQEPTRYLWLECGEVEG